MSDIKNKRASLHVGIFGPGLSGKTTLAKALCASYYADHKLRSIVLDPNLENWGPGADVHDDANEFWAAVWAARNCMIFVDEAAETIGRNKALTPLFTRIRHRGHKMHVMGHSGTDLLPVMRRQLSTLFLFRQSPKAAEIWTEEYCDERLMQCAKLRQYEFLHAVLWGDVKIQKLCLQ